MDKELIINTNMQKKTRSLLDELTSVSFAKDKENVVESRASHIIDSAIRLISYIKENFDPETAYKLEKRFHSSIKIWTVINSLKVLLELKRIKT